MSPLENFNACFLGSSSETQRVFQWMEVPTAIIQQSAMEAPRAAPFADLVGRDIGQLFLAVNGFQML